MSPLRVCFLNDHVGWRGASLHGVSRYFLNTVPGFDPARIEAEVAILKPESELVGEFVARDVPIRFLGGARLDPGCGRALWRYLAERRFDVVHAQGYGGTTLARLFRPFFGYRTVMHSHDADDRYPAWLGPVDRLLSPLADAALANADDSMRFFEVKRHFRPGQTQLLHNGIDLERAPHSAPETRARVRAEIDVDHGARMILTLTRFSPEKGNTILVEAIPDVLEREPRAVFVFAGQGEELDACRERADALGVSEHVRFLGFRTDADRLLASADVAVIPSLREGTCYALLEALAHAVPVVASDVGGLAEVLEDDVTGRLVTPGDPKALAQGLSDVLADDARAASLAQAGRERVRNFDLVHHVDHLTRLYEALVSGEPLPSPPS